MVLSLTRAVAFAATLQSANAVLNPRGPDAAGQIRLAYHGSYGMTVSWNTFDHVVSPTVKWGLTKDNLNRTSSSDVSLTYPTSSTYNNHVVLDGLKPDTRYYYLPSPLPQGDNVEPLTFTTSRLAGAREPFSVAVVVDLGTMGRLGLTTSAGKGVAKENILKPGEKNTIDSLAAVKSSYDFIWHPGDIAYADAWLKEEIAGFLPNTTIAEGHTVYEAILNDFYDEMAIVTETKPYMVGPGNHEANCNNGGTKDKATNITYDVSICSPGQTNFTGYKNHFRMPSDVSGGTGNFWYSWDHGIAHFIQLDTETDLGHGLIGPDEIGGSAGEGASPVNSTMNAQTEWLAADLAAVNRTKTPWVVVAGHRPWYLSAKNASDSLCTSCKDVFEPLLIKYGVDLVLTGHAHIYERFAPLANGKVDPNELNNPSSPWYITNGAAGHYDGLDSIGNPRQKYSRFALDTSNATYGWSKLTFHNCSHLTHEFVASNNNTVLDTAILFKDRNCAPESHYDTNSTAPVGSPSKNDTWTTTVPCATSSGSTHETTSPIVVSSGHFTSPATIGSSIAGYTAPAPQLLAVAAAMCLYILL